MKSLIAACLLAGFAQIATAQGKPEPILPEQLQWAGPADAAQNVMVVGAADKAGLYQQRVRMPAGAKIHSRARLTGVDVVAEMADGGRKLRQARRGSASVGHFHDWTEQATVFERTAAMQGGTFLSTLAWAERTGGPATSS